MTRIGRSLAVTALAVLCLEANARAQTPTPAPDVTPAPMVTPAPAAAPIVTTGATKLKVGGTMFVQYQYDMTPKVKGAKNSLNAFDVTRAYVNIEPSWGDDLYARITPDITRATVTGTSASPSTTGNLVVRLKYAYIGHRFTPNLTLIVGLQKTPFTPWQEDAVWGYRVLGPVDEDTFYGMTTSDFGLTALVNAMDGRLEVHGGVYDGEKYTAPETNKYKQFDTRATYTICPAGGKNDMGLRLTAYGSYGLKSRDADRVRGVGLLSYTTSTMNFGAEYVYAQDGNGAGKHVVGGGPMLMGYYVLPISVPKAKEMRVVARVDMIDPDNKTQKDGVTRIIGGVAIRTTDKVQLVLDYQSTDPEASGVPTTQGLFAHWEAKF